LRRLLGILALTLSIPALLVLGVGAEGDDDSYRVRAIFDNVASAVPGEDVKVAGAKVGVIESMDVTDDKKAAVVLKIEEAGFVPFRANARCIVRPQSLIGEKFIECDPGDTASEPLEQIPDGEGEGEHLLALERTSSTVDLDLVNNVLRRPFRERLAILLGEFGTGLAGRGEDLNEAIHRANPALRETDRVLQILSNQNRVLADLARDSDRALAPLAREKVRVTDFIENANETGQATAARRGDIERGIERLPAFLRELRPLMADLDGFAGQATPVMRDLNLAGEDISRLIRQLGPFSEGARVSLESLGEATETGRPALIRTRPLIRDLADFGRRARPVSTDLDRLTASLDRSGGIERLMDFFYFSTLSVNGFDDISHYLRAATLVNTCSGYALRPTPSCDSHFSPTGVIRSAAPAEASAEEASAEPPPVLQDRAEGIDDATRGRSAAGTLREERSRNVAPAGTAPNILRRAPHRSAESAEPVLDYLLGSDG